MYVNLCLKSQRVPENDAASSPDVGAPPSMNPFDGLKSEDEEEEQVVADSQEEEEEDQEVDEAELEAFLDGQLEDSLQDGSSQTAENQEPGTFGIPSSKGEEALRTCKFHLMNSSPSRGVRCPSRNGPTCSSVPVAMLKQVLFNHMLSREAEEGGPHCPPGSPEGPSAAAPDLFPDPQDSQPPSGQAGPTEAPERNGEQVLEVDQILIHYPYVPVRNTKHICVQVASWFWILPAAPRKAALMMTGEGLWAST